MMMDKPKRFQIADKAQAVAALDYFNGFHDGFIKRIEITSHDRMEDDRSQLCTGEFDLEMDIAHYNYAMRDTRSHKPFHPHDQLIRLNFQRVQDVLCDLREARMSHVIIGFEIHAGERCPAAGLPTERCLRVDYTRHHRVDSERWETRSYPMLTFTEAEFRELPPATPVA